jgi:hypothetical protein
MRSVPHAIRTPLAAAAAAAASAALVFCAAGCSVTVPESRAPAVGALQVSGQREVQEPTEGPTTAPPPAADAPPSASAAPGPDVAAPAATAGAVKAGRPLNRAEELLPRINVKPWRTAAPVVVQSASKDMQCSIGADGAACHLLNEVPPRPGDVKGLCTGLSQYYGGYAVVTLEAGPQYGLCGDGVSPMEAEGVAGPPFPGPWIEDGQTVRIGNMVCSRDPAHMVCAHLRTGHGFLISAENYELW